MLRILLVFLLSNYKNFVESFVLGKDSIILEEVKPTLYIREHFIFDNPIITVMNQNISGLIVMQERTSPKSP